MEYFAFNIHDNLFSLSFEYQNHFLLYMIDFRNSLLHNLHANILLVRER